MRLVNLYLFPLVISLFSGCTLDKLKNNSRSLAMACGDVEAGASYTKVLDAGGNAYDPDQIELLAMDQEFALLSSPGQVTSKGCVKHLPAGRIFVRNKARTLGLSIDAQDDEIQRVRLMPLQNPFENIQLGCDSLIYSEGDRFLLRMVDFKSLEKYSRVQIDLRLSESDRDSILHKWPRKDLSQLIEYDLKNIQLVDLKEYELQARLSDPFTSVQTNITCRLRNDKTPVQIALADKIATTVKFLGRNFYTVLPGYTLNFYAHAGFKDINAEYCAVRMNLKDLEAGQWPTENCEPTAIKSLLHDSPVTLQEGLWMVRYRGLRGQLVGGWQTDYVLVDKVCVGRFTTPQQIVDRECTKVVGSMFFSNTDLDFTIPSLVHTVVGDIAVRWGTSSNGAFFKYLSRIDGSLIYEEARFYDLLFESLEHVAANIEIYAWSTNYLKLYSIFPRLKTVGGLLRVEGGEGGAVILFDALEEVGSVQGLRGVRVNRDFTIVGDFNYSESLFNELAIKSIGGGFVVHNTYHENFSQLPSLPAVNSVDIRLNENLLVVDRLPALIKGATGVHISGNIKLENVDGLLAFRELSRLEISKNDVLKELSALKNLQKLAIVEISGNSQLESIDFSSLQTGRVLIQDNVTLQTLSDFSQMRMGEILICGCPALLQEPQLPANHQVKVTVLLVCPQSF